MESRVGSLRRCPSRRLNSGAVTITAMITGRHRGVGGRPSGKSSRASGMQSPIAQGQDQAKTVWVSRSRAIGSTDLEQHGAQRRHHGRRGLTEPAGQEQPADRIARPMPGQDRAAAGERDAHHGIADHKGLQRIPPGPTRLHAQPDRRDDHDRGQRPERRSASTRSGVGCGARSMCLVSAVSAPEVSRTASRFVRATSRRPRGTRPSGRGCLGPTIEVPADGVGEPNWR